MSESHSNRHSQVPPRLKKYGLLFYETMPSALMASEAIIALCQSCDQVNVVIRAEGVHNEAALLDLHPKVKVFAGSAWWLIHERRKTDGWYDTEQE